MKATKQQAAKMAAAKRKELQKLTGLVMLEAAKTGKTGGPNALLRDLYAREGHTQLNTFLQWKKLGYKVKKGVTALLLWSAPITIKIKIKEQPEGPEGPEEVTEFQEDNYYNYISLFSNLQVEKA